MKVALYFSRFLIVLAIFVLTLTQCEEPVHKQSEEQSTEFHTKKEKYTENGFEVEIERTFSPDGIPILNHEGYHSMRREEKNRGPGSTLVVITYLDLDNALCLNESGYCKTVLDSTPERTYIQFFGTDNKPIIEPLNGNAKWEFIKNPESGDIMEIRHYGADDELINSRYGAAVEKIATSSWDSKTIKTYTYYDSDGKPAKFMGLFPVSRELLDDDGNELAHEIYDFDQKTPVEINVKGMIFSKVLFQDNKAILYNLHGKKVRQFNREDYNNLLFSDED